MGETMVPIARNGEFLYNAIISADCRSSKQTDDWLKKLSKTEIFQITGMSLHPSYSLNKIIWFKEEMPDIYEQTWKFLLFEDLLFFLFGLPPTVDTSLAGRTMALDVREKRWSRKMLGLCGVDEEKFAQVLPSGEVVGQMEKKIADELGFASPPLLVTGGHDQPVNALGAGVVNEGKAVDGTGTVECVTVGFERPVLEDAMLEQNYSVYPHVKKGMYVTIAFNYTGGNLLRWYRDNLAAEEMAQAHSQGKEVYDVILSGLPEEPTGLLVLPHFVGTGTPHLDAGSKGAILGLTLATKKKDLVKGLLEGVTFEIRQNLESLEKAGVRVTRLRAIGGGARSSVWLQLKADILGRPISTINVGEAGCLGAAILAGVGSGEYASCEEAVDLLVRDTATYEPRPKQARMYDELFKLYQQVYPAVRPLCGALGAFK
jgi:xylulokinase